MNNNVRIIAASQAAASPPGTFPTMNIATTEGRIGTYQTCTQVTLAQYNAAPPGIFPTVIAGATGAESGLTKGLKTILVTAYTAPA